VFSSECLQSHHAVSSYILLCNLLCNKIQCMCAGTLLSHYPAIAPAVSPREFALIGAAAFSTGVTRAVSTTVIVYELSGQRHLHLPLSGNLTIRHVQCAAMPCNCSDSQPLGCTTHDINARYFFSVAVVTAYFVGNRFSKSAYDVILGEFRTILLSSLTQGS
jgi:hypothetical protein